jgi:MFS transporter, DHA2 family, multidrug resistance protein
LGWQAFETRRHGQASALAYCDCFWIFAALTFVPAFTALLMKRAVAEKGAHPVSE